MHLQVSPRIMHWALPIALAVILLGGGVTATALALESQGGSPGNGSEMNDIEDLRAEVAELREQMHEALAALDAISAAQPTAEQVERLSEKVASVDEKLADVVATHQADPSVVPTVNSTPGDAPAILPLLAGSTLEWRGMMLAVERADPDPDTGSTAFTIENLAADDEAASAFRDISVKASNGSYCLPKFVFPGDSDVVLVERGQRFTFEVSWVCAADRKPTGVVFGDVVVFEFPNS